MSASSTSVNKQVHLASRPDGEPSTANFAFVDAPMPDANALKDGQVLVRVHYMSVDPYMRGRMNDAKSYAQPQPLNQVMQGGTVGEVVASKHASYKPGDKVVGFAGWQQYHVADANQVGALRKVDTTHVPLSAYLGSVGMPGVTAWYGLVKICKPKDGETIAVSAASGAVGSVVGQLAKARGCRVIGIAGGAEKCAYVTDELGFDACIDYKQHADWRSLTKALKEAAPNGIDGYFDNVGGMVLNAILPRMNAFGRMAICGMIAGYNGEPIPIEQPQLILQSRLLVEGFIVSEHMDVWGEALKELGERVGSGKLKFRESVAQGIENAPEAFLGMLKGKNFGKQVVKLV
ncbi:MAG: 2-alkenal reductase [Rhizobacter sp.]|nr:2-alkenal reductase [Rhizobacter sp.]